MIPLAMATQGERYVIKRINGKEEMKKHLEALGFVTGSAVTIVSELNGNIIVKIRESRIAINKELATKILI